MEVEYNENFSRLADQLKSIDRPGHYCMHEKLHVPMPRMTVEGVGTIAFPVLPEQVRSLITVAEQAPYGKGPHTLLDTSVRNCRQISPGKIELGGASWRDTFARMLDHAAEGLGCPRDRTSAKLYKLLLYEPGGFFASHRDTEKEPGMVATLVIALPTTGSGGELVVRHAGHETRVNMRAEEASELNYAAFYCDCEHEVLPVVEGHRICLVYNLLLETDESAAKLQYAPDFGSQVDTIAALLEESRENPEAAEKIVWLLEHNYSEAGLSFPTLKNIDASVARTLKQAADRAGFVLHAAIVHIQQAGSAEYSGSGYGRYDEEDAASDYEMDEVFEDDHWLDDWVAPDGEKPAFVQIPLRDGELMPEGGLDDAHPDEEWLQEATGNAGVTLERTYRAAALVLWPREKSVKVLSRGGAESIVQFVESEWRRSGEHAELSPHFRVFLSDLIDFWPAPIPYGEEDWQESCSDGIRLLRTVGDNSVTLRFLREIVLPNYAAALNDELLTVSGAMGPRASGELLAQLVREKFPCNTAGILDLAWRLSETQDGQTETVWREVLQNLVKTVCETLPLAARELSKKEPAQAGWYSSYRPPESLSAKDLQKLFQLAWQFDLQDDAEAAAALLIEFPKAAPPLRALPQAVEQLWIEGPDEAETSRAFKMLWRQAAKRLLERSELPPVAPGDWVLPVEIDCRCEHCTKLQEFCSDPVAHRHLFRVRQNLREHLRKQIRTAQADIDCVSEKRGSPHTLVCTKTRAAYKRRLAEYADDIAEIRRLVLASPAVPLEAEVLERLRAAAARSS